MNIITAVATTALFWLNNAGHSIDRELHVSARDNVSTGDRNGIRLISPSMNLSVEAIVQCLKHETCEHEIEETCSLRCGNAKQTSLLDKGRAVTKVRRSLRCERTSEKIPDQPTRRGRFPSGIVITMTTITNFISTKSNSDEMLLKGRPGQNCSTNEDCLRELSNSVCYENTCFCKTTTAFSFSARTCVQCGCSSWSDTFSILGRFSLKGHNEQQYHPVLSMEDCQERCLAEKTFRCLSAEFHPKTVKFLGFSSLIAGTFGVPLTCNLSPYSLCQLKPTRDLRSSDNSILSVRDCR